MEKLTTKAELKSGQDKIEKLQTCDSGLFIGQSNLNNDRSQNFQLFQRIYKTFKIPTGLTGTLVK